MSVSAILSPTPVSAATSSAGSTVDAAGSSSDFGAILATEISEDVARPSTPVVRVASDAASTAEPIETDVVSEEQQSAATEIGNLPVWLVPQLPSVTVDREVAATGSEGSTRPTNDQNSGIGQILTVAADVVDEVNAAPLADQETPASDKAPAADATQPRTETIIAPKGGLVSAPGGPLAEAALASLRALPGAGALQQATVSQRKTEAATVSNAAQDDTSTLSGAKTASALTVPPAPDLDTGPDGPKIAAVDLVVEDLSEIAEVPLPASDSDAVTTTQSALTGSTSSAATADTSLSSLSRATIETTAQLAAQITSKLAGRSTRFELGLTPEGLGRVDVTLDIDADGQLSARLAFDNPLAATELRGRADELRRQLEDAGFTVARDALDFSSRDNPSGGGTDRRQQRASAYADRHAAHADLADAPPAWTLSPSSRLTPQGVDVKV